MALLACGANESYDAYLAALERHVTERYAEQGTLDALMATEYSRTILTVAMLGGIRHGAHPVSYTHLTLPTN